jgi:hypothetical protein
VRILILLRKMLVQVFYSYRTIGETRVLAYFEDSLTNMTSEWVESVSGINS